MAGQSVFSIYAVPSDGNCMFSAVSHKLQITGVGSVESNELRAMVANHFEANSALYTVHVMQCQYMGLDPIPVGDSSNVTQNMAGVSEESLDTSTEQQTAWTMQQ